MLSTFLKAREQEQSSHLKKLNVLLLSFEWWSRKGGISTLNRVLAIQLAKHPLVDVTVFLPECSEEEKKEAVKHNINVVKAEKQPGMEKKVWLCVPPVDLPIDVVIGHGEKLGPPAKMIRDRRRCRWVQIVHTIPKELGMFKTYGNPIIKSEMKHEVEVELSKMADLVVGVGPKLSEAFRCYLRWCKKDPDDVINLTPGIFNEYSDIQHAPQDEKKCRVLVFGRDDEEDFALKGFDITAKAVALLPNTKLIFAGVRNENLQKVANRLLECGISQQNLEVRGFLKSTQEFIQLFCEVDLALLPSRSDGFGLTALEALSAGLPVLVSRNTGFGEALSKVPFGSFYVIDSEDPSVWASAIEQVWKKDRATRLQETENLRTWYGKKYNWESQCNDFVNKLRTIDSGKNKKGRILANCWPRLKSENLEHNTRCLSSVSTQNILEKLRREVEELEAEANELEQQLKESEEKLLLEVEFPSIDSKQQKSSSSDKEVMFNGEVPSEAEVAKDMERQVMANNIRILTLEKQNGKSKKSISVLMNARENISKKRVQEPVPLWKQHSDEPELTEEQKDLPRRSPAQNFYKENSNVSYKRSASAVREGQRSYSDHYMSNQIQPHPPEKPRAQSAKTRTMATTTRFSETKQSASLSAKPAANGKHATRILGRLAEGHTQKHEWEHSPAPTLDITVREGRGERDIRRTSPASTRYTPMNVFVCMSCDKMYTTQKDLDIHKSFCYDAINANYT